MTIYLQFGHIGQGSERISNEIPCGNARQAMVLAANICRVSGKFDQDEYIHSNGNKNHPDGWARIADRNCRRIKFQTRTQDFFVELIKR